MNLYIVTGITKGLGKALADRIALDPDNELIALARAPDGDIPGGVRFALDLADTPATAGTPDPIAQRSRGNRNAKAGLTNNPGTGPPAPPPAPPAPSHPNPTLLANL